MLIIDTYNVLHLSGDYAQAAATLTLARLVDLLGRSRFAAGEAILVCDGNSPAEWRDSTPASPHARVLYSGTSKDADSVIIALVNESTAPRRMTIVTNDRRIAMAARRRRARVLPSETFLGQLLNDAANPKTPAENSESRPEGPLEDDAISEWLNEFGLSGNSKRDTSKADRPETPHERRGSDISPPPSTPPSTHGPGSSGIRPEELDMDYWLKQGYGDPESSRKKKPGRDSKN